MSEIKSVAIAGASGTLGAHALKALLDANFDVTVLTRSKGSHTFDANVKVVEVDFTSVESLTAALQGIDGLVATLAGAAIESQTVLIDAAVAAGVRRFVPSEYGSVTTSPKLETMPIYATMFKIRQYLQEKAAVAKLSWTILRCGAFLEYLLLMPNLLDFSNQKAVLIDGGDSRISATSLPSVGKAIAGIFQNPVVTENKILKVSQITVTQNELVQTAKELKPDSKWELSHVQSTAMLEEGLSGLKAGDYSMPTMTKIVVGTVFAGDKYGAAYDETDNEVLGVESLSKEYVKKVIAEKLA